MACRRYRLPRRRPEAVNVNQFDDMRLQRISYLSKMPRYEPRVSGAAPPRNFRSKLALDGWTIPAASRRFRDTKSFAPLLAYRIFEHLRCGGCSLSAQVGVVTWYGPTTVKRLCFIFPAPRESCLTQNALILSDDLQVDEELNKARVRDCYSRCRRCTSAASTPPHLRGRSC